MPEQQDHQHQLQRQPSSLKEEATPIDEALADEQGAAIFASLPTSEEESIRSYMAETLKGCVFVGHTSTDTDSVGSAIGAAVLFNGIAARASEELNGETKFVLQKFQVEEPPLFKTLSEQACKQVCLVDHNQTTQMAEGVIEGNICGVIDHHALQQNMLRSEVPIIVDIKPWGSTCTIIAREFWKEHRAIPEKIAGVLLAGILSDTLNLRSPTTTKIDKVMVGMLSKCTRMSNTEVNELASAMFKAKAQGISDLTPHAMILGDHKVFSLADEDKDPIKLGFGVIETTDPDSILLRKSELLLELRAIRKEMRLDFSYAAVVDILKLHSTLLMCGQSEEELAKRAFKQGHCIEEGLLNLGSLVSRKHDFIPALDDCLQKNDLTELTKLAKEESKQDQSTDYGKVVVEHHTGSCFPTRRKAQEA